MPVTQAQPHAFLTKVFGSGEDSPVATLVRHIDEKPLEGKAYAVVASHLRKPSRAGSPWTPTHTYPCLRGGDLVLAPE